MAGASAAACIGGWAFGGQGQGGGIGNGIAGTRRREEFLDPGEDAFGVPELAFPDREHAPAQAAELAPMFPVVGDIAGEFIRPEFPVALGGAGRFANRMPMPEAAVDENDGAVAR